MNSLHCWSCGHSLSNLPSEKLSFRAECENCRADLHCCLNCKFYKEGAPNDCLIPGIDPVRDKSKNNFCDEFVILGEQSSKKVPPSSKNFDDLFK